MLLINHTSYKTGHFSYMVKSFLFCMNASSKMFCVFTLVVHLLAFVMRFLHGRLCFANPKFCQVLITTRDGPVAANLKVEQRIAKERGRDHNVRIFYQLRMAAV